MTWCWVVCQPGHFNFPRTLWFRTCAECSRADEPRSGNNGSMSLFVDTRSFRTCKNLMCRMPDSIETLAQTPIFNIKSIRFLHGTTQFFQICSCLDLKNTGNTRNTCHLFFWKLHCRCHECETCVGLDSWYWLRFGYNFDRRQFHHRLALGLAFSVWTRSKNHAVAIQRTCF